ncbi:hypothetical protein ELI38_07840 [Rhizobium leguminosarum]|uniref:hypothetical protein n=1 Tax=Rhizobium leguminosarum TaxID=384 RepID=UPI00103149D5|nr:hypothetical protein [Rhizobium leguminosarum]NKK31862.1 hypothetical protein [Rhizobium leguminosarum bv. viciae]TAU95886.1 hypothetical protein ELI38_07840 [Rhizobium leguminosarum]
MIKLTDFTGHYREIIYVNIDHIVCLYRGAENTVVRITGPQDDNEENLIFVAESPETVVQLIKEARRAR